MSAVIRIADEVRLERRVEFADTGPVSVVRVDVVRVRSESRFREIKQQSEQAIRRSQELGRQFFRIEVDLGNTFLDQADMSRHRDSAVRCKVSAEKAWRAAGRTLYHLRVAPETRLELEQLLGQLRRRLDATCT